MIDSGKVHIAVMPPAVLNEDMVKSAAEVLRKNVYDTRVLLSGEIPRIIAHYENIPATGQVVHSLKELGIDAIAFNDSQLRQPPQFFKAYTLSTGTQDVLFKDRSGREKRMRDNEAFLIITGMIQTSTETEIVTTRKKLNVATTLLTGGIPIYKKVKEKKTTHSTESDQFMRLYSTRPDDPVVLITRHDMDYSFLGERIDVSTRANFILTVAVVREALPNALYNDMLVKPFKITSSADRSLNDSEVQCRLIYEFSLAKNDGRPAAE
jgi:hypothetical protein